MPLLELRIFLLFVTVAPSAVRSLSNGRTPSSSSEEEEHGLMKNTDSASAKSEDVKSEVGSAVPILVKVYYLREHDSDFSLSKFMFYRFHRLPQTVLPHIKHLFHQSRGTVIPGSEVAFPQWMILQYLLVGFY